jgi:hypothetical protein
MLGSGSIDLLPNQPNLMPLPSGLLSEVEEADKATPPANFQIAHARIESAPLDAQFKAAYLRSRALTELAAIRFLLDNCFADAFDDIETELRKLTYEEILRKEQELARKF